MNFFEDKEPLRQQLTQARARLMVLASEYAELSRTRSATVQRMERLAMDMNVWEAHITTLEQDLAR